MACFRTSFDSKTAAFEENDLFYVHCVSKENFSVILKGFTCVSLVCREIHVSFIEQRQQMDERRRTLVPVSVENLAIDELFAGVRSPVLIRIGLLTFLLTSLVPFAAGLFGVFALET